MNRFILSAALALSLVAPAQAASDEQIFAAKAVVGYQVRISMCGEQLGEEWKKTVALYMRQQNLTHETLAAIDKAERLTANYRLYVADDMGTACSWAQINSSSILTN